MLLLEKFLEQGQISLWGILRFLLKEFVHYQKDFHNNNNQHIQQCTQSHQVERHTPKLFSLQCIH